MSSSRTILFALAWLVACVPSDADEAGSRLPDELVPEHPCAAPPSTAGLRGAELERRAELAWERAPFAEQELPRAVVAMAESARCFTLAGDVPGKERATARRERFTRELAQRAARAELGISIAQRTSDAAALRRHVQTLLALTSETGPTAAELRERLMRLDRMAARSLAARGPKERS